MFRLAMLSAVLFCGGCGWALQAQLQKEIETAGKAHVAETADCERLYPDKYRKPTTPRIKCFNEANLKQTSRINPNNVDLAKALAAEMLAIAEQYDAGRLTPAQYEAAKTRTFSDYTTRAMQRQNGVAMAEAAQQQAAAASMQAYGANRPRTCNTWGNTVTCY